MLDRLESLEREFADVEARLGDPALIADQPKFQVEARRHKELDSIVGIGRTLRGATEDLEVAREMFAEAEGDDREELREEVSSLESQVETSTAEFRLALLPKDPNDDRNAIVEIRGAEGGEEANLFARDLYDMFRAFSSRQGWKFEMMDGTESDMGGFTTVTFSLSGDDVWSRMKFEAGVHRVQRVPKTESQGRVHTSSATVAVLPEAEEVEVQIDNNDLKIDYYRVWPGRSVGQHHRLGMSHHPRTDRRHGGDARRKVADSKQGEGHARFAEPAVASRTGPSSIRSQRSS